MWIAVSLTPGPKHMTELLGHQVLRFLNWRNPTSIDAASVVGNVVDWWLVLDGLLLWLLTELYARFRYAKGFFADGLK